MTIRIMTVALRQEQDVVGARQRARQISGLLGFEGQDQVRIATAVSEIARNAFRYARGGEVEFAIDGDRSPQMLTVEVSDSGPGITDLDAILAGRYRSATGMGLGIVGARRLMDQCTIRTTSGGTTVALKKILPDGAPLVTPADVGRATRSLAAGSPGTPMDEVQQQNRELVRTLEEVRERQEELTNLNRELEDTNRGVVALYAELEERADFLRRADETKSRFLSSMSHEFRTPLNSIRALTHMLLARSDGPINSEQEIQLNFISKATSDLTQLVDDLLDLAKIEAGKIEVRPAEFTVADLFSALRGMLRPLLVSELVALRFEDASELPEMHTDEGKVSQILRNLISNALKFTERGEIRVSAVLSEDGSAIVFSVADTGIGVPKEDHERIFEEFTQVRSALQARVKGTGLGLPLCRRLATLLGGSIALESRPGQGSTFSVTLPVRHANAPTEVSVPEAAIVVPSRTPVLVVEDQPELQHFYETLLRGTHYDAVAAHTVRHAKDVLTRVRPAAIVLDIMLGNENAWRWLADLKGSAETAWLPVIIVSSVDDPRKGYALGADAYLRKPVTGEALLDELNRLTRPRILIVDDDPAARYTIRKYCERQPYRVLEAADAREGLLSARTMRPRLIVLDLNLPDQRGEDVLRELASGTATSAIPVVIATSETLSEADRDRLQAAVAVFSKSELDGRTFERLLESLHPQGAALPS